MRNRALHDALREFALEAAAELTHELQGGAEIPFDVVEEPGGRTVLYNYHPLTSEFIAERWASLRALPAFGGAAEALGSGAENYLRTQASSSIAPDSEPALKAMLERIYADATSFEFPEERFERVYAEVERALFQNTLRTAIVAPLHGFEMEHDRLDIGDGMFLIAGDKLDAPPGAVWSAPSGEVEHGRAPNVLCVLRRDVAADAPLPIAEARARFHRLLTALRLFKPGGIAFGALAWARVDEGAWQPLALGGGGDMTGRGTPWALQPGEGPELVELVELITASNPGGRTAWALARFEMGCERAHDTEALSDYLLALESLLDARDESGRATLTLRLAALCAEEGERRAVQRGAELAFALERWVMGGGGANAYLEALGPDTPRSIVLQLEQHLRALLRDVLCGYLGSDLRAAADDVLLTSSEPIEIKATDTRRQAAEARAPEPEPEPKFDDPGPEPGSQPVWPQAPPMPDPLAAAAEPPRERHQESAGVTQSADWDWDDDPDSYSAPV
ncbi:MAG: hypothetical protein QOC77_2466 [Thermoleophilaceae bacterium]|jgi:hypothetical protein|nr:hypothetical protein [Thermoleophilaceae bacterium]MEA2469395.1 hypothetical protein [Thermoleophilaceae bacterium]